MQHDPATVGASDSDRSDLVDVTLQDGKYTIRQVSSGRWECLRYGEPWPAFEGRQPDNLHTALAYEVDHLRDQVDELNARWGSLCEDIGIKSRSAHDLTQKIWQTIAKPVEDLDAAVGMVMRCGRGDWVRENYPAQFERLMKARGDRPLNIAPPLGTPPSLHAVPQLGGSPEDLRNTLCAVIEFFGTEGAQKVTEYVLNHRGINAFDGKPLSTAESEEG